MNKLERSQPISVLVSFTFCDDFQVRRVFSGKDTHANSALGCNYSEKDEVEFLELESDFISSWQHKIKSYWS